MSGSINMYKIGQIVRYDVPVVLPNCMYKLKNIHGDSVCNNEVQQPDITQKVKQFLKNLDSGCEMAALQQRQEILLKQLEELKNQMILIRAEMKQSTGNQCCVPASKPTTLNPTNIPDVVINVNPDNPPLSLLILKKLWANQVQLNVQIYLHSTVASISKAAQMLGEELSKNVNNYRTNVNIRLIWKEIGINQMEFYISNKPILGEVNFLRYIARTTGGLGYDEDNWEIDSILDICYSIARTKTKTEKTQLIQTINKKLGKSEYLFGKYLNIADIAAYSAIKQVTNENEINANIAKWLKRIETS